jgi:phosphoribosylformylglycinamidine cyclo-ligase
VKACAHITGGGLIENPPRVIAPGLQARFDWAAWTPPPVFDWLSREGGVAEAEMRRTFNCGLGLVLVVSPDQAPPIMAALLNAGETAEVVGELSPA